jgi:ribonuclease HI
MHTVKSFTSRADAEAFLAGRDPSQDPASQSFGSQKYYAVRNGRVPGVYTDWPSAQEQITGWTKPKHRCFSSRAEAEAFVKDDSQGDSSQGPGSFTVEQEALEIEPESRSFRSDDAPLPLAHPPAKRSKKSLTRGADIASGRTSQENVLPSPRPPQDRSAYEPGRGPLPAYAEDGFDPDLFLDPQTGQVEYKSHHHRDQLLKRTNGLKPAGILRIYTDGSSLGNGREGAVSGVGVYFGDDDER